MENREFAWPKRSGGRIDRLPVMGQIWGISAAGAKQYRGDQSYPSSVAESAAVWCHETHRANPNRTSRVSGVRTVLVTWSATEKHATLLLPSFSPIIIYEPFADILSSFGRLFSPRLSHGKYNPKVLRVT